MYARRREVSGRESYAELIAKRYRFDVRELREI